MRRIFSEYGDTLIEVTIALAILSSVLIGASVIANRTFQLGQSSNDRARILGLAQQQMEALQIFRDTHTWAQFNHGNRFGPPPNYEGVDAQNDAGVDCVGPTLSDPYNLIINPCFHMEQLNLTTKVVDTVNGVWTPVKAGGCNVPGAPKGAYCAISTDNPILNSNGLEPFYEFYGNKTPGATGSGLNQGEIVLRLSNIDGFLK